MAKKSLLDVAAAGTSVFDQLATGNTVNIKDIQKDKGAQKEKSTKKIKAHKSKRTHKNQQSNSDGLESLRKEAALTCYSLRS